MKRKTLEAIKALPFAPFMIKSMVRWKVVVREPVIDGERLLVVDFLHNGDCTGFYRPEISFRIVCSKKHREVKFFSEGGALRGSQIEGSLRQLRMNYVEITEREEKRLARFLDAGETRNHQIDRLLDWVREVQRENKEQARRDWGGLMDEDYQLCPEALPEGLIDYIRAEILPQDNTLIYKKKAAGRGFADALTGTAKPCDALLPFPSKFPLSVMAQTAIGYKELTNFRTTENYLKNAEMQMEDDFGMIDGIINNGPKEEPKPVKQAEETKTKKSSVLAKLRQYQKEDREKTTQYRSAERDLI